METRARDDTHYTSQLYNNITFYTRCGHSLCSIDNRIYSIGGYDEIEKLSSVEVYDSTRDRWSLIADMHHRRSDAGCTAFMG